MLQGKEIN
jgi:hypothetical protein